MPAGRVRRRAGIGRAGFHACPPEEGPACRRAGCAVGRRSGTGTRGSRSASRSSASTRRCCRRSFADSSEAGSDAGCVRRGVLRPGRLDTPGLWGAPDGTVDVSLRLPSLRSGGAAGAGGEPQEDSSSLRREGPQLQGQPSKRRLKAKLRETRCEATRANETWAMAFVHDRLATGRKLRAPIIADPWSRFHQAVGPRLSCRGEDVVATPDRVCAEAGFPKTVGIDQGSEFVSRDLDLRARRHGVALDFSRPGKPTDSASIEAFNGRFRRERLSADWFLTPADAREKDGALAQVLRRRPTPRRDRVQGPDIARRATAALSVGRRGHAGNSRTCRFELPFAAGEVTVIPSRGCQTVFRSAAKRTVEGLRVAICRSADLFTLTECANHISASRFDPSWSGAVLCIESKCFLSGKSNRFQRNLLDFCGAP